MTDIRHPLSDGQLRPTGVFTSINSTQRSRLVREQLEEAIAAGTFKPGARLPSERDLAGELGVSRVSVREAMRSLEALGVIQVRQGRGCFVSDELGVSHRRLARELLPARELELVHLLKVRAAIETLGAEEAALSHDAEGLSKLTAAHERFLDAVDTKESLTRIVELDVLFHEALADLSGNELVAELTRQLNARLVETRRLTMMPPGRLRRSAREHEKILEGIVAKDPKSAARAMRKHVQAVEEAVVRFTDMQTKLVAG